MAVAKSSLACGWISARSFSHGGEVNSIIGSQPPVLPSPGPTTARLLAHRGSYQLIAHSAMNTKTPLSIIEQSIICAAFSS